MKLLKTIGERVGVRVYPHRLRHTCATQLLNAGCRVTSIQVFLGHKKLNTTMIYARAHDQTVVEDYYAAMERVEQRLEIVPVQQVEADPPLAEVERQPLLELAEQLAVPELSPETRLVLVAQMRWLLNGKEIAINEPVSDDGSGLRDPPPVVPIELFQQASTFG